MHRHGTAALPVRALPCVVRPLPPEDLPGVAALLAEGIAFAPEVMARLLLARQQAGTLPLLLGAYDAGSARLLGGALLDLVRPVAGGRLFARVSVAPGARGRGLGTALARQLRAALPAGAPALCVEVDGDDDASQAVARHWGGSCYQRSLSLELDLPRSRRQSDDLSPLRAGVTVETLRADSSEQEWREAFAVYAEAARDLPDRDGAPPPDYAMFRAQVDHPPGVHLARQDGRLVGISGAGPDEPDSWYVFFTGTLPCVRGTGVARALKTALHQTAREHGVRRLVTSTLDVNRPMLALNASLGYEVTGAIARYEIGPG